MVKVVFMFPLTRKPTKSELDRLVEWAITFYEVRNQLVNFELVYA